MYWGFPKIRGTLLVVPIMRIIVFWGLEQGPPIYGNYHILGLIGLGVGVQGLSFKGTKSKFEFLSYQGPGSVVT